MHRVYVFPPLILISATMGGRESTALQVGALGHWKRPVYEAGGGGGVPTLGEDVGEEF